MKTFYTLILLMMSGLFFGCATPSKVQTMIDAAHQDYQDQLRSHESSIDVLKQSSVALIEQNRKQAELLKELQTDLEAIDTQLTPMKSSTEAARVMSAANTVKVADLTDATLSNQEAIREAVEKMDTVDRLIEQVLIKHYQGVAENAKAAISVLQADDIAPTNGASSGLADPIEIVAPDTSGPTDGVSVDATAP